MKFGKVEDIEDIDFRLPAEDPNNRQFFVRNNEPTKLYIGATGWSMKEWKGKIYPEKTKASDYLYHYSRQFNAIELNSTHYRIPAYDQLRRWQETVPEDFKFCPKIWKNISHRKDLSLREDLIEHFFTSLSALEGNLGMTFIQLPPYFTIDKLPLIDNFLGRVPRDIDIAVEVRHASFFIQDNFNKFIATLIKHNAIGLITDVAGRRDVLHSSLSTDKAMIRWVGNGLHLSDYERLDDWAQRIIQWANAGANEIYFFPHEPDNVLCPQAASYLSGKFSGANNIEVRGPRLLDTNKQLSLL